MKKVAILVLTAAVAGLMVLFVLFGGFGSSESGAELTTLDKTMVEETDPTDEPEILTGVDTLDNLKVFGNNTECRISYESPDLTDPVTGTYFISGEKTRGDFEIVAPELGGTIVSSMIFDENTFYSWSNIDGQLYGIKADTSFVEESGREQLNEPVPDDQEVKYECFKWHEVDGSIFEPPSDVLFQDVSNLLNSGMEYGTVYEEGEF